MLASTLQFSILNACCYFYLPDAPAPVTNLRAQDITYDSVELTWNLPTDDGGSSPSFIVDKKEHGSEVWSRAASTGMNKATLLMLTPNMQYTFRVRADNMYGSSEPVEVTHTIKMKGTVFNIF